MDKGSVFFRGRNWNFIRYYN